MELLGGLKELISNEVLDEPLALSEFENMVAFIRCVHSAARYSTPVGKPQAERVQDVPCIPQL